MVFVRVFGDEEVAA